MRLLHCRGAGPDPQGQRRPVAARLSWRRGRRSVALLGISAYTPAKAAGGRPDSPSTLFTNVRLFDGLALNTRDGRVGAGAGWHDRRRGAGADCAAPDGATVIDGGGRTLMPGLIDAHWHTMLASLPIAVMMTADVGDIHFAAAAQAERTLMRGFTTVRDAGGPCLCAEAGDRQRQRGRAADLSVGCDDLADLGPWRFPQHLGSAPRRRQPAARRGGGGRPHRRWSRLRCCRPRASS